MVARLTNPFITSSNSSVNSSLTNNAADFPLGQPFYVDFTHDDIIVSVLTALSLDYLRVPPSFTQFPPNPSRPFILSNLTPFGGRLITETIGCSSPNPAPVKEHHVSYTPTQYGYDPNNATYKFVRMRLNNGVLPLNTIRGGACGNATSGRVDGLCELDSFVSAAISAYPQANYTYSCFGNYTLVNPLNGTDYDGTATGLV
jgi:hypothetical protein